MRPGARGRESAARADLGSWERKGRSGRGGKRGGTGREGRGTLEKDFPGQEINPLLNPGGETGAARVAKWWSPNAAAKCGPTGTAYFGT